MDEVMRRNEFYLPPQISAASHHNARKWCVNANGGRITSHMVQIGQHWAESPCLIKWAPKEGSETPDCQPDHLIHRKRSPFPYEGKA